MIIAGSEKSILIEKEDHTIFVISTGSATGAGSVGPTGPTGPTGPAGAQGIQGLQGPAGATGANGLDGDSAYEIAVAGGFVGTESEWLLSLQGATGPTGPQGAQGLPGADGAAGPTGPTGPTGATGPNNGKISLYKSGLPVGILPSGSIGNNGAYTSSTTLSSTYPTRLFAYFGANVIAAGVAAGLYYVEMSSTTAGTIYNNTYTGGVPEIPASKTAFSTTGPGAFTQTTNEITLLSPSDLVGGTLGVNGELTFYLMAIAGGGANTRNIRWRLGGTEFSRLSDNTATSVRFTRTRSLIQNSGALNYQVAPPLTSNFIDTAGSNINISQYALNTVSNLSIAMTGQLSVATDWIIALASNIEALP